MTLDYTEYKLSPEEQDFLEREYIEEIVSRIIRKKYMNGDEHHYFGAMLSKIEKLINKNINFLSVMNLDHTFIWRYDADTKYMVSDLSRILSDKGETAKLGIHWLHQPSVELIVFGGQLSMLILLPRRP